MNQSSKSRLPLFLFIGFSIILATLIWFAYSNYSNAALGDLSPNKMGFDGKDIVRSIGDEVKDPFAKGAIALTNKDYTAAATFFESIPDTSSSYTQARLYLAYSQYELKAFDKTIANTKIVIGQSAKASSKQKAEWLQLQAMLASGDTDDAEFDQLLDRIAANEKHTVHKEAGALKQSMNSFWRGLVF